MKTLFLLVVVVLLAGCVSKIQFVRPIVFCEYGGETYRAGAGSIPALDGINSCFCDKDGEIVCTEKSAAEIMPLEILTELANPAAEKCVADGFHYELRETAGFCSDETNRECGEWAYFREECVLGAVMQEFAAELTDSAGGSAFGTAQSEYAAGKYTHAVTARDLPPLLEGYFYEGWLVRVEPLDIFSTGELATGEVTGEFVLSFESPENLTAYTRVVVTLEPDDGDPTPAEHVLDGQLQLISE